MKNLIVYYSFGGNTKRIAQLIQKTVGGDLQEIKTVTPYTGSYNDIVNQGQDEVESGYMPPIEPISIDYSKYDNIFVGTPVWWYTFAPAVHTFLENTDFQGKKAAMFATNGGWLGHTLKNFESASNNADVQKGIGIKFNEDRLETSEKEIVLWAEKTVK